MLVCAGGLSALAFISEVKSEEPVVVEGKILVRYESSLSAQEIETIEKEFGLQRLNYMSAINTGYYRISGSEDQIDLIERLRKKTGVVLVEEDLLRTQSAAIPNDPLYGQQWYLNSATATHINFQSAIQAFSGTTTIDVAVIDSGILYNHPDFVGKINTTWAYDYVDNDTIAQDENGHGTMVASLIGAAHNNGSGLAGVCPNVRFLPLRVLNNAGREPRTSSGVLVSALQRAYDANVRIVNLSLGGGGYSPTELSMFEALNTKGILAVIAAGNGDPNTRRGINNDSSPTYPASYNASNIISVMATDSRGDSAGFSNYGSSSVDIAAPGVGVLAANVRRSIAYNDSFASGFCGWEPVTASGGTPWQLNSFSVFATFSPYNAAGIYKYFNFTGKQGLRAELTGFFMLGWGDYVELEKWNGASWEYVDIIVGLGGFVDYRSLDISAFDGLNGYARIVLHCDVYEVGAFYSRSARIESIKITEVSSSSTSDPEYLSVDGTSLSAPLVAGTAALLLSKNPALTGAEVKQAILSTASTRSSLSGKSVTGGIVNVSAALAAAQPKQSQTISFSALPTKTYGDADFAVNATASSGLSVSYSSSDASVAAISGNTVSIVGAGTATITASQLGDSTYSSAASVQQTLTINKKNLVIVADNKTKEIGQSDPILTYTSFGLLLGSSITGALSRSAGESVGTYNINQGTITAGNNYAISFTQGTFAISPAAPIPAVITLTSPSGFIYDGNNKAYGVTVASPPVTAVPTTNIALNKSVTASSVYQDMFSNYSPNKIVNGSTQELRPDPLTPSVSDSGNYWLGKGSNESGYTMPAWLIIDLGQSSSINLISILNIVNGVWNDRGSKDFNIQVSLDNSSYSAPITSGTLLWQNTTFQNFPLSTPVVARYVKINITSTYGGVGSPGINEIRVMTQPVEQSNGTPLSSTAVYTGTGTTVYGPSSTAPKNVGSYRLDVTCTDSSYSGTKTQEFSIAPKSATVVAVAKTKVYGSADPSLTYTSSGLVGSDSLSGALTRTAGENVGSYDILVGTLSAGPNYTLSYTGASLGITANTLSSSAINITAPSSLVYDGTGKGHTASASGVSGFSYTYTGVSPTVYPSSATAPTDAGTYSVAVSSADANYSGSKTANFTITPMLVTITAADKTKVYGSAEPTLTYTSSGLVGSDSLSGDLTRTAGENVGSYDILVGTLSAGPNYTLSYTGASLGITASTLSSSAINISGPSSLVYDGTGKGHTASASGVSGFNYTYTGVGPTVYPSSATAPKDVGTYTVTASSTDLNNSGSKVLEFLITPKSATVTAVAKTKVYGSPDPALTYTSNGLVGSDSLSGALTRTDGENVGSYAIQIGTLSAGPNYTVSFTEDSMEITPKEVAVVASPKSKLYKSGDPALTFTSSSLLGSDSIRGDLTRVSGENVGFYEIRIGTLSAGDNYSLKYTAASLEITPQPLTVTAVAKTKAYGSADPSLTYTSSGLIGSDSLSGALTRAVGENVGSYNILVGTLSAGANYTLSYTGASLEITAASLGSSAINITPPSSLVYDGTGKGHTASASGVSGFSYTYTGVSPTEYPSSTTAPKDVGTYTVTASSTDINQSGSKTANFTITPRLMTITAADKTKVYGSADPTLTYTASGLIGSDTLSGALIRAEGENAGSYRILQGTLTVGSNYSLSYTEASLQITPAPVTVVAAAKTKTFGSADPALTYTASGFIGSDALSGALTRAEGENAGSYSILQGTLSVGSNYSISYTGSSLQITSAMLSQDSITITAPFSLVYDGAGKSHTASASGVSGFIYTYSGVSPTTYASSSTAPSNVGTYKVTASSADPNYSGSTEVSFSITPTPVTVVVAAKTKTFGSADPALTYTASGLIGSDALSGALTRAVGENAGNYNILQGTLSVGSNYSISYTGALFTVNPAELASSAINITEPSNLVYNGLGKEFVAKINISGSTQSEIIQLSKIGNPNQGYGLVKDLAANGYKATSFDGIDGVFRPYQNPTLISSTGITYSFSPNLVGTGHWGDDMPPWKNSNTSAGSNTANLNTYFAALGIDAPQNSLFAHASSGITFDLSEIKPTDKVFKKFTTYYGNHSSSQEGDVAYAILLDGVLVASERNFGAYFRNYSDLIEVDILPTTRFLTLVSLDNGDQYFYDHGVFVDPKLIAVDSEVNAAVTYSGIAGTLYGPTSIPPSNAGNYKVTASSSDPNYSGSKEVNFVITPAPIVVVAQNKTKKYGLADPELTFSATGLIGSDTLSGALTRATGESPGTYAISLGTLSGTPNYLLSYTGSSLVIQPNYQSWAVAQNLFGNDALKDSDPDQDGMSNAHEFAMGGNPSVASTATIIITSASGGIKFLWIQRKDKTLVTYLPKTSADLGAPFTDWTPVHPVLSNPQPEGIHSDYEQVEVIMPTNGGKGFLKVQATIQ